MNHIKAYITWLSDNAMLGTLVPADVPNCRVRTKRIAYLSKEEMALLMQYLEQEIATANADGDKHAIHSAYLWRAVVWILYTA